MENKTPFLKIFAVATAIVAVSAALAAIISKLCCHLISFYAVYQAPTACRAPDYSETDEQPVCPDAAR